MAQDPVGIAVRAATPDDTEAVVRIYVESWNAGFGSLMPTLELDPSRLERWREALCRPPPAHWWVAERESRIAGFAGIGPSRDPIDPAWGELDTIAVDPAAWRTGVGTELMSRALRQLRSDGYRSALLWTLNDYPRGAAFYRATGWRRSGASRDGGRQLRFDHALARETRSRVW